MREIKFRAFENGKMYHSDNHGDARLLGAKLGQSLIGTFFNRFYGHETLCQFTGLKDKNGKDIYEGDIDAKMGRVFYYEGAYLVGNSISEADLLQVCYPKCNIIGNIHENSEILK